MTDLTTPFPMNIRQLNGHLSEIRDLLPLEPVKVRL
jgi:hypothetical protein